MRLWSRLLIVAGIGVVLQGLEEGQAAVPVGGGRAQPGFKIDHSKPYTHETHAVPVAHRRMIMQRLCPARRAGPAIR